MTLVGKFPRFDFLKKHSKKQIWIWVFSSKKKSFEEKKLVIFFSNFFFLYGYNTSQFLHIMPRVLQSTNLLCTNISYFFLMFRPLATQDLGVWEKIPSCMPQLMEIWTLSKSLSPRDLMSTHKIKLMEAPLSWWLPGKFF